MKQQMMDEIAQKLATSGILVQLNNGTDLSLDASFLDASWGAGNKQIEYHMAARLDPGDQTVYFWELTKESGSGLSMSGNSETSFQSGVTLMRKVKAYILTPEGTTVEYQFDLGLIPKTIKETAKAYGWKFKVVLKKDKVMTGIRPSGVQQAVPFVQAPQSHGFHQQTSIPGDYKSINPFWTIIFVITAILSLSVFMIMSVSIVGWVIGLLILMGWFMAIRRNSHKGFFFQGILWLVCFAVLFIVMAVFSPSQTTEVKNQTPVASEQQGTPSTSEMQADQPDFYVGSISAFAMASSTTADESGGSANACVYGQIDLTINQNAMNGNSMAALVDSVTLSDFKILYGPASGTSGFYTSGNNFPSKLSERQERQLPDPFAITVLDSYSDAAPSNNVFIKDNGGGQMQFFFCTYDLFPVAPEEQNIDLYPSLFEKNGFTADNLRAQISFNIVVKTSDGAIYVNHQEPILVEGNFLTTDREAWSKSTVYSTPTDSPFIKQ